VIFAATVTEAGLKKQSTNIFFCPYALAEADGAGCFGFTVDSPWMQRGCNQQSTIEHLAIGCTLCG
jgi:hypothetical protein